MLTITTSASVYRYTAIYQGRPTRFATAEICSIQFQLAHAPAPDSSKWLYILEILPSDKLRHLYSTNGRQIILNDIANDYAELKNISTGNRACIRYGKNYRLVVAHLFKSTEAIESYQHTVFAIEGFQIMGHISFVTYDDYAGCRRNSRKLVTKMLGIRAARAICQDTWRALKGTRLGPWKREQMYIESLAVFPAFRRKRVALELLEYVSTTGKKHNVSSLSLHTHRENTEAIALYSSFGFLTISERFGSIRMEKRL